MSSLPTASKMSLALRCSWPWGGGAAWDKDAPGYAAERGNRIHAASAKILDPSAPEPVGVTEDEALIANAAAAAIQSLCPVDAATTIPVEVTFAYDPIFGTAKVVGSHLARDYSSVPQGWLVGTADVVWVTGKTVNVLDIKTGLRVNTQPVSMNDQLLALALYASRAYDCDEAIVHLLFASDEGIIIESATHDGFALDCMAKDIADMMARVEAKVAPAAGAHCKYCPVKGSCPEIAEAEGAMVTGVKTRLPVVTEAAAIQGQDHAAYLLAMVRAVRDKADLVEKALKEYADAHDGIRTGEKVWQKREVVRESVELDDFGVSALRRVMGHHALDAFKMTATKTDIARAAKAAAQEMGLKAKQLENEALDALRALGAIKTSASTRYEEK
jgi:hypothetical protein